MTYRIWLIVCTCLTLPLTGRGQERLLLYPDNAPCGVDATAEDVIRDDDGIGLMVEGVNQPALYHYAPIPAMATGSALVIAPGGGYAVQAWEWEGEDIARSFVQQGMHVFVLRYRLPRHLDPPCKETAALDDVRAAIALVRDSSDAYGYAPDKIALMGFSAGGHLAASGAVHYGDSPASDTSARPNLSILVYPVIIMDGTEAGHSGSAVSLLGEDFVNHPRRAYFDLAGQVHPNVPPTLLIHASDDTGVPPENSIRYYQALLREGVEASLHIYPTGGHGFASAQHMEAPVHDWLRGVSRWLAHHAFVRR